MSEIEQQFTTVTNNITALNTRLTTECAAISNRVDIFREEIMEMYAGAMTAYEMYKASIKTEID
jgi:hypothetical protein